MLQSLIGWCIAHVYKTLFVISQLIDFIFIRYFYLLFSYIIPHNEQLLLPDYRCIHWSYSTVYKVRSSFMLLLIMHAVTFPAHGLSKFRTHKLIIWYCWITRFNGTGIEVCNKWTIENELIVASSDYSFSGSIEAGSRFYLSLRHVKKRYYDLASHYFSQHVKIMFKAICLWCILTTLYPHPISSFPWLTWLSSRHDKNLLVANALQAQGFIRIETFCTEVGKINIFDNWFYYS